ncbi:hypothetical protein Hanom_Chr16g01485271 [Helianthus anomalus]
MSFRCHFPLSFLTRSSKFLDYSLRHYFGIAMFMIITMSKYFQIIMSRALYLFWDSSWF